MAVLSMARRLKPGGLLVLEPWFTPGHWHVGPLSANFVEKPDLKLARFGTARRRGKLSVNDQYRLVASRKGVEYFVERLEMGLFTDREYRNAFKNSGLEVNHDGEGLMGRIVLRIKTLRIGFGCLPFLLCKVTSLPFYVL